MIDLTERHDCCKFLIQEGEKRFITPIRLQNDLKQREIVVTALWDTGAEVSVVSLAVAKALGLPIEEGGRVTGIGKGKPASMAIAFAFPGNKSWFTYVLPAVVANKPGEGFDFIIGMDIISMGSLNVEHSDEGTLMEFVYNPEYFVDMGRDTVGAAKVKLSKTLKRLTEWLETPTKC